MKPHQNTSPISDLQRASAKAGAAWDKGRKMRAEGKPISEVMATIREGTAEWNRLTNNRVRKIWVN